MADGFSYGGFSGVPYPYWLSSPSSNHPVSAPRVLISHPVESYDPTQGGFDPMISHCSYHRSPPDWSNNPSYRENSGSQTPSSSFYPDNSRLGNCGPRGEDFYKDMSGFYSSRESSSDCVPIPGDRHNLSSLLPTYNSTTSASVSSSAEMLTRNSQEPFYQPIAPFGHYHPGYDIHVPSMKHYKSVTDSIPSFLPMPSLKTEPLLSQTGIHSGDGRSFPTNSDVCSHAPEYFSVHGSSVDPVNFDVLLGYGEATGHVKPLSENPDIRSPMAASSGLRSPGSSHPLQFNIKSSDSLFKDRPEGTGVSSSLDQRPVTLVAESGVSESSLKNTVENLNFDEPRSWSHFMVSSEGPSAPTMFSMGSESCGAIKPGNGNTQSAVTYKTPSEDSANQPSEDVEANQQPCKLQEQMFDIMNRDKKITLLTDLGIKGSRSNADDVSTGQSPERHLCDQGDFPSLASSPRVSSVVNAMHNLSEVLVYECFNNGSCLKLEQLENLDKVVDNLTKCLKKITGSKTTAGEASLPTQAIHVSCRNVVDLNEAPKGVAKDFQEFNVKPTDSFGFKESGDKNEMTQGIKNILASNFPDGEENNPQTLLYKNLWLETEADLCSTTCMARFHRIKNEIGNLNLNYREISADASVFMEEPSLNPEKSVPIMNNAEQETTESLINDVVTKSHDPQQSSRFNSDPVDAVLSLMSRSFTGGLEQTIHGNFKPDAATSGKILDARRQESHAPTTENEPHDVIDRFQILKHQETKRKLKSQNCPGSDVDVIDRFQILNQQETQRKLKSQNCPETKTGDHENNMSDVMDRFQILKRREAEQVQKSLNIDSDSDNDQPGSRTPMRFASMMMTRLREFNSQIETCADDTEPSASGNGCESLTSDWEHVLNID